jgi:ribosomal protein L37AE/L43A
VAAVGNKLGQGGSSGPRPDWVPPKGTARSECPDCNKKTAYHKKLPDKDWSMWTCLECKSSFFDDKGKVGKKMRGKK